MEKISKFGECEECVDAGASVPDNNMKNGMFTIPINGVVGDEVTAQSVNEQLEKADGQDIVLEVASPGGSVFEGVEIFNAIRNYEGKTETKIVGMAASMASYISLASDKVFAEDNATFMIHNAWGLAMGDSEEMRDQADVLESINKTLAKEYVNKTGKTEKEVLKMMGDETWLFGDEMKKERFVDEMITHEDDPKDNPKRKKKDKESALIEARDSFKSTLLKIKGDKMKADIEKMKDRLNLKNSVKKMAKFVKWTAAYKKSLPDSAFALSSERKLPFMDADGKVDVPHLRNALIRVAQGKTGLSPVQRSRAMSVLRSHAGRFLKIHNETKSGQIMTKFISKFAVETTDRLGAIIKVLKEKATNLKPEDDVSLKVKQVSLLIQDLEEIVEVEKAKKVDTTPEMEEKDKEEEEKKEEESKPDEKAETEEDEKPAEEKEEETKGEEKTEEEKTEEKKKEGKKDDDEEVEESKFRQAIEVANGYRDEIKKQDVIISKFQKELEELRGNNAKLTKEFSKFKEESHSRLLDATVEKISKFKGLSSKETLDLKKKYLESKMSETALVKEGRKTDEEIISKLQEPKPTTKPTEMLEPAEKEEQSYSKMSDKDKLDALADLNAKRNGFVVE